MKKNNKLFIGLTAVNLCFLTACFFTFNILSEKEIPAAIRIFIFLMETFILFHLNCWFLFLRLPLNIDKESAKDNDDVQQTLPELKEIIRKNTNAVEKMNIIMQGKQLMNLPENAHELLSSVQTIFDSTLSVLETIENRVETEKIKDFAS
ncbi:hypothetical protein J7L67_04555 [bacterium]|nr:hypothetical protein [bacterium]